MKDINGKELKLGHIVAVRYVWNSYVGIVRIEGLSLWELANRFAGGAQHHRIDSNATYQILGHIDENHNDFNKDILNWAKTEEDIECPIKIRIYENQES